MVPEKPVRTEIYTFKDNRGQERFKSNTSKTMCFSKCFSTSYSVLNQFSQWQQAFDGQTKLAFPKFRVRTKQLKNYEANNLITKRNKLPDHTAEANELNNDIAKILAEEERSKTYLFKQFCHKSGATDMTAMWKLKKPGQKRHMHFLQQS